MLTKPQLVVRIAPKEALIDQQRIFKMWMSMRNMSISRRQWHEEITKAIYFFPGIILTPDGRPWPIPDLDKELGDPRWLSYFFEERDGKPRRTVRLIERLSIIDLYFQIAKPNIYRHFIH